MAEVQKHTGDVLECATIFRNRREIEKRKEERMGVSLVCTSLAEKAPVSRSACRRSSMLARILVLRQENGDRTELAAQLLLDVIDLFACPDEHPWRFPVLQQRQRRAEVAEHEGKRRTRNGSV
jgi:hypothetical protein